MRFEIILFLLRLSAALSLIGFMSALFWFIWRELQQTNIRIQSTRATYGYLISIIDLDGDYKQIGEKYPLLPITTLGRSATNAIVVGDTFASSEHARIVLENGQWWLEDRDSRNGTLLNDEKLLTRTILTHGDIIGIGSFAYKLELNK